MIEKILKATVICEKDYHVSTLKDLRNLGILHVEQNQKQSSWEITAVKNGLEKVNQALVILSESTISKEVRFQDANPKIIASKLVTLLDEIKASRSEIDLAVKDKEKLQPWGDFFPADIETLENKGIYVYLCYLDKKNLTKYRDKGVVEIISIDKGLAYFALISTKKYLREELNLAPLPTAKKSLSEIDDKIAQLQIEIGKKKKEIDMLSGSLTKIKEYQTKLEQTLEFSTNKENFHNSDILSYIKGYVPEREKEILLNAAKKGGWAVLLENLSKDDDPPVLINPPKIFRLAIPIFDFLGISPSYNEWDISGSMLVFFSLFFAMIIGDAGYGSLFLVVALGAKIAYRRKPEYSSNINLFILLSSLTIIWGVLTGSYFGMDDSRLPKAMRGIAYFKNPDTYNSHMQYFCFLIAAIHLSLARIWKTILYWNSKKALGQIGWALVIWGNFFTAVKIVVYQEAPFPNFAFALYGVGILLILFFFVRWHEISALFELPLSLIGSFIDVLSYIRLFAVGIAAIYIAENFNQMGVQIMQVSPWFFIFGLLIIVAGHVLNIMLSLMAVLVHGVRLNILEFSNHMELTWGGVPFRPFAKKFFKLDKTTKIKQTTKEGVI